MLIIIKHDYITGLNNHVCVLKIFSSVVQYCFFFIAANSDKNILDHVNAKGVDFRANKCSWVL